MDFFWLNGTFNYTNNITFESECELIACKIKRNIVSIIMNRLNWAKTSKKKNFPACKHREIISKYYQIKPKSDCIYHFPTDLESNEWIDLEPN